MNLRAIPAANDCGASRRRRPVDECRRRTRRVLVALRCFVQAPSDASNELPAARRLVERAPRLGGDRPDNRTMSADIYGHFVLLSDQTFTDIYPRVRVVLRVNTVLRRAMYDAGLTELDLSVELAVDPKTVRNWMHGQVPHEGTRTRWRPSSASTSRSSGRRSADRPAGTDRPVDLVGVYPRSATIDRSGLAGAVRRSRVQPSESSPASRFPLRPRGCIGCSEQRSRAGVRVRIVVASPTGALSDGAY